MQKLSVPTARLLRNLLWEHGKDWGREAWMARLENAPRIQFKVDENGYSHAETGDDGLGDIPWRLRNALLAALHAELAYLMTIFSDPEMGEDEVADAGNDATRVYGLISFVEDLPFSEAE